MSRTPSIRVFVGLSGGVDSSTSALLLRDAGYRVEGLFMKNWVELDGDETCPVAQDVADARGVAETLGLPFHTLNFAPEYWDRVFSRFLAEYRAGRTPNPDILCNKEIKFDVFLKTALEMGADVIATGHYARIDSHDGRFRLMRAVDQNKDQTYFLYALNQFQLSHALFPVGHLPKPEVRRLAEAAGLITHDKKDSTGICFIGEKDFGQFLSRFLPAQPGDIVTPEGNRIGTHQGLMYYTLGQRKGLGIGGRQDADESPWFVVGKRLSTNALVVAQGHNHPLLFSSQLTAGELNWISGEAPPYPVRLTAKTRYRQVDQACTIAGLDDGRCTVIFDVPQRAMTPGQSVVFYRGEECLGGGVIEHVNDIIYH